MKESTSQIAKYDNGVEFPHQLKDTPEKSNNQIAKMLGVSDHTVKKYREELEKSSQIANFSKREDPRTGDLSQPREKPKTISTRTKKDEEKAQEIIEKTKHPN